MLYTIEIGTCVSVQGEFVGTLANGQVMIRDGSKLYCGRRVAGVETPALAGYVPAQAPDNHAAF